MPLLQTYRESAPFPTAKFTSNPAGYWAWVPGREGQSLDLTKAFDFWSCFHLSCFCHLHFYFPSYRWPGQSIAIFNNRAVFFFELFFKVGFTSFRGKIESFQFCPYLNLLCAHAPPTVEGRMCMAHGIWNTLVWMENCSWHQSDGVAPESLSSQLSWWHLWPHMAWIAYDM
jgi:hypothetical protein